MSLSEFKVCKTSIVLSSLIHIRNEELLYVSNFSFFKKVFNCRLLQRRKLWFVSRNEFKTDPTLSDVVIL